MELNVAKGRGTASASWVQLTPGRSKLGWTSGWKAPKSGENLAWMGGWGWHVAYFVTLYSREGERKKGGAGSLTSQPAWAWSLSKPC